MTLISDDVLLRDPRPAAELRRALLAPTICRIAYLRRLGRFTRMADALDAIAADQERRASSGLSDGAAEAMARHGSIAA